MAERVAIAGGGFAPAEQRRSLAVRIAGAPFRATKALGQMLFARNGGLVWRFMPRTRFNYAREVGDGTSSSVIMAPILWIARAFPEAPLQVLDADLAPLERHRMVQKIRRPNPYYSGIVMWMATLLSWIVDGNAYWLKIRDGVGGVAELYYVPHWMIEPESDDDTKLIQRYVYSPEGRRIELGIDEVVHFRYGLDPGNVAKGLSPLGSVLREVFTDDEAANFAASLLHNLGIPGLIVSPKEGNTPSPDDVKAVKDQVDDDFSGDNRGKPLVMSGPTDVEQFGFSPEQMSLRLLRRVPEERVTAVLGLPAIVAGFGAGLERSTFANYGEAREAAWEDNIIPSQRMFGEDLRHQLLVDFVDRVDEFEIGWDRSNVRVLQEDRAKEAERLGGLYKNGVMRRAEARRQLNLDTDDADEVFAVPVSTILVPAGTTGPDLGAEPKGIGLKGHTRAQRTLMAQLDRDARVLESVFTSSLVSEFSALGQLAGETFTGIAGDGTELAWQPNGHTKDAQEREDRTLAERVVAALGIGAWIKGHLKPQFEQHWQRTMAQTVETLNNVMELATSIPDEVGRQLIRDGGTRAGLVDISEATTKAIMQAIAEARAEGLGPASVARRIRELVPAGRFVNAGPAYRAQLIARTETKYAQNISSIKAAHEAGTVTAMVAFDARLGGDTDPECESRDGQEYSLEDAEVESANEHPNGSLSFAPVVASSLSELEGAAAA